MNKNDLKSLVSKSAPTLAREPIKLGDDVKLWRGRIHEVTGTSSDMFAILAAARQDSDIVWIGLKRDILTLCPTGLEAFVNVERLLLIEAVSRGELLWAADQALRANGKFCIILDMADAMSLKESRRLQLAAEQGGGLGLIILRGPANTSAAQTRWHCAALQAEMPSWRWECVKGKNGETGAWHAACQGGSDAKDTLHMAATSSA